MDSGLFSLMFGVGQGTLTTFDEYRRYTEGYLNHLRQWGWKHAIVECDVQRILNPDACEKLRDEFFRSSEFEVIYVWHMPDGLDRLRELARTSKRIALSVPELRNVTAGTRTGVKPLLLKLLSEIRSTGATPRIHLLGNTENKLIRLPSDSCDSSTWMSACRWGQGYYYDPATRSLNQASVHSPKWRAWRRWCEERFSDAFTKMRRYYTTPGHEYYYGNALCSAVAMWMQMEALDGADKSSELPRAAVAT
jgi:hypothetical protein